MITWTLAELADLCGAELDGDGARVVEGPATLAAAGPREISFCAHTKYKAQLASTRAAAVVVALDTQKPRGDLAFLRCIDPNAAFTRVVSAFAREEPPPRPGLDPSAVVDPTATLGRDVSIGPCCVVGPGARVGDRAVLVASVALGRDAVVGPATVLHPGVVVYPRVVLGARCIVHAGAVLGADGFGFEPPQDASGWIKIPQCGHVEIGDDVEIGANTTIDRGRFGATRIGRGTKIDNLVHVGHNVVVGDGVLIVAQVGIAGSTQIGDYAILGGQAGISGHVEIGARARIASQAGVIGDVPPGEDWLGFPARPRVEALRTLAQSQKVPKLLERVRELERRLDGLANGAEAPAAGVRDASKARARPGAELSAGVARETDGRALDVGAQGPPPKPAGQALDRERRPG